MYINGQIEGHEELLAIHKAYASSGDDPMARGASIVGVTGIESHLVMLKSIKSMLS
jgi:putative membrane protein